MREKLHKVYHVYITASRPRGVLYVGMTSDLAARAWQHRERVREGFSKRYWVDRVVYFEAHDDAHIAARRERAIGGAIGRLLASKGTIPLGGTCLRTCSSQKGSSGEGAIEPTGEDPG
jgi:predicted GIY-YIG superfamily endonuclease